MRKCRYDLFLYFSCRDRGVNQDLAEAYRLFAEGAEKMDLLSASLAGNLLMRGAGVPADYKTAFSHFQKTKVSKPKQNCGNCCFFERVGSWMKQAG